MTTGGPGTITAKIVGDATGVADVGVGVGEAEPVAVGIGVGVVSTTGPAKKPTPGGPMNGGCAVTPRPVDDRGALAWIGLGALIARRRRRSS